MHKMKAATEYLEDAIRLYDAARYPSALMLAAAAQELFGKQIEHSLDGTKRSAFHSELCMAEANEQLFTEVAKELTGHNAIAPRERQEIKESLLHSKNTSKHFRSQSESELDFDVRYESSLWIVRAIRDYRLVFPDNSEWYHFEVEEHSLFMLNADEKRVFVNTAS